MRSPPLPWHTREELPREGFDYIEIFSNTTRRHSAPGMLSLARYGERYSLEQLTTTTATSRACLPNRGKCKYPSGEKEGARLLIVERFSW
jgi:hypothetical protein